MGDVQAASTLPPKGYTRKFDSFSGQPYDVPNHPSNDVMDRMAVSHYHVDSTVRPADDSPGDKIMYHPDTGQPETLAQRRQRMGGK